MQSRNTQIHMYSCGNPFPLSILSQHDSGRHGRGRCDIIDAEDAKYMLSICLVYVKYMFNLQKFGMVKADSYQKTIHRAATQPIAVYITAQCSCPVVIAPNLS